ncbi:MAG: 30S ribosomal protein S12 methylthiotransferase RimO [Spirochaetaceae bacterium]|nr:30S ribosomal protein S12 methylthiotransferase RimO [Spirochaetaceae bacterium]
MDQHGCAKNQVDGEEIVARLEAEGFEYVPDGTDADLVIVNTCGFIESAKKESIEAIAQIKNAWPEKKVLVAGCLAQRYPQALLDEMQEADGIFGNADLSGIGEAVRGLAKGNRSALTSPQPWTIQSPYYERKRFFDYPGTAHVKITEGCSNHCAYCAIPLIRGELRSRPMEDILAECRSLIARGFHELDLVGQDLGAYGRDLAQGQCLLPQLLDALTRIEGDFRVRVLYIHPDHFPEGILPVMARDPRILPYFDLPFQHSSEKILKAMNRVGSEQEYLDLIENIRSALGDTMIRSTFLVGFPGETDEDFAILQDFQKKAQLDWLGSFTYSREEDTPAYSMKGRVPKNTARARQAQLESVQEEITVRRLERFVGVDLDLIIEEQVEGSPMSLGRAWMQAPDVDGLTVLDSPVKPGSVVRARITGVRGVDLLAEIRNGQDL